MTETGQRTSVITQTRTRLRTPSMYNVVMYNDDFTTMEFVVMVLMVVFDYDADAAFEKMMAIHNSVKQVVGHYVKTIAEFKVQQCNELKKEQGFRWFRVEIERENGEDA